MSVNVNGLYDCLVLNRKVAAHPNGHWIKTFRVKKSSENSFKFEMTPAYCGKDIPLISIEGVPRTDGDQQSRFNFTEIDATIMVTRDKAASPPLTGTFDITFGNKTIRGIRQIGIISTLFPYCIQRQYANYN